VEKTTAARLDPRAALAAVGLVFVVAVIWAATALASGGSSGTPELASGSTGDSPPASVFVQSSDDPAPSADDCPERDGGGRGSSGPGDTGASGGTL